jgi:hypothetical protein
MHPLGYAADGDERALSDAGAEIVHSLDELPRLLGLDWAPRSVRGWSAC